MIFQFFNNNDISCQLGTIVTYMSYANWGIYVPIVHKVLRTLKTVKSINDLKTNRNLLSKINTNISTLKCYNFDLEGDDIENSSFQIEMDETIPHIAYTKWAEEKIKIKEEGEKISIEGFIQFYTNQINIEEKAQYVRKQSRPNDINKTTVSYINSINSYYTTINQPIHEQKRSNYGNQPNKGNGTDWKPRNDYQYNKKFARSSGNGGLSTSRYCIFYEADSHDTRFCKIAKYSADYKTQQCQKHNSCYMCFKTS